MPIKGCVDCEGIRLYTELYLPPGKPPFPAVCICHGIPAHAPDPTDRGYPLLAETISREGFAALIFNFRGAGLSGGNFDMLGWLADLKAVLDYLFARPEVDTGLVNLLGFSAGAAAAICTAAADRRVLSVLSCASPAEFTLFNESNVAEVIAHFRSVGVIKDPAFPRSASAWLARMRRVKPLECVGRISPHPILIMHGDADETVPVVNAHRLYQAAGEPRTLLVLPGGTHRLRLDERAVKTIIEWLKAHSSRQN